LSNQGFNIEFGDCARLAGIGQRPERGRWR
jgi:hypothetical protein